MRDKNLFSLKGKIAFLSGASGHLGAQMAEGLCLAGAHVIINGRNEVNLRQLEKKLSQRKLSVSSLTGDITDLDLHERLSQHVQKNFKKLDIIVNNASYSKVGNWTSIKKADFQEVVDINLSSPLLLIQKLHPLLKKAGSKSFGGSSIINLGSMYGMVSPDPRIYKNNTNNPVHYGAAKSALIQMTRYMSVHLAQDKIRVNCISPGPFPPQEIKKSARPFYQKLCGKVPMGRIGFAKELIGPLIFLASEASSFVTGVNLPVDGGWTVW